MENYSFKKGLDQIPYGKAKEVKAEIMQAFKITSNPAWLRRMRGTIEPRPSEIKAVEEIFKRYGIKQIWGE